MRNIIEWIQEPIQSPSDAYPWRGFLHNSRCYMAGTPRWQFLLGLPTAAARFHAMMARDRLRAWWID
jgi:hypothetical protein